VKRIVKTALSAAGIQRMIDVVEDYRTWLEDRANVLLRELSSMGYDIASAKFESAVYDGTNDANVKIEEQDGRTAAVVAVGASVLFIEFGTGVMYPDNHPEAARNGMVRGAYGKGHGKQRTWGYYGDPGTNGVEKTNPKTGNTVVLTHGNPANMSMYDTVKELSDRLPALVKEVFR